MNDQKVIPLLTTLICDSDEVSDFSGARGFVWVFLARNTIFLSLVWEAWLNICAIILQHSRFEFRIAKAIVRGDFEWNLNVLAEELSLIEPLKKLASAVPRSNFPLDNVHSEGDSVKFASLKSSFPYVEK
jgi:hypothetical protein